MTKGITELNFGNLCLWPYFLDYQVREAAMVAYCNTSWQNSSLCGCVRKADCKVGIVDGLHGPTQPEHIFSFALCSVYAAAIVPDSTCVVSKQCFFAASQL